MRGCYVGRGKMLVSPVWGGKLIVPSDDLSITPDLILNGVIEVPLTRYLGTNVKNGNVVVDVGANVGYFSVLLGHLVGTEGRLHAYEANPYLYGFLMDNLSINYLHDRTNAFNLAVYSTEGNIPFFVSKRYMGNSSTHLHNSEYHRHYVDEIEEIMVNSVALDRELKDVAKIDLLKIDIEGGELSAFQGMQRLIRGRKIKTIVFELNKGMLQDDWGPFISLLSDLQSEGRNFFLLSDDGTPISVSIEHLIRMEGYPHVVMK